jgi:NAD(P)H-dependent FMN reductase
VIKIGIIIGSTRPGRHADTVGRWIYEAGPLRSDAEFEIVDLADYVLPHLDEPLPPAMGQYSHDHTKRRAATIDSLDGFIFVTPEYNHSTSRVLKNAIDYLHRERGNKAAGFASYGAIGGTQAVEHLRLILGELPVADVRQQVAFSLFTDFENFTDFKPAEIHEPMLHTMFHQIISWSTALAPLHA